MVAICHRKSWTQKYRTKEIYFCQIFDTSNSFCDGSKCTNRYQKSPVIERELHTLTQFLMTFCVHLNKKEFFCKNCMSYYHVPNNFIIGKKSWSQLQLQSQSHFGTKINLKDQMSSRNYFFFRLHK